MRHDICGEVELALIESLGSAEALSANQAAHLSGCGRCARTRGTLLALAEGSREPVGLPAFGAPSVDAAFAEAARIAKRRRDRLEAFAFAAAALTVGAGVVLVGLRDFGAAILGAQAFLGAAASVCAFFAMRERSAAGSGSEAR
jgi:hypothetical protein